MKNIRLFLDYFLVITYCFVFIFHLFFTAIFKIEHYSIFTNAGYIFVTCISLILLSLLISLVTLKNIFNSYYPLELNSHFRIVIFSQFVIHICILIDYLQIPNSYGDFINLPTRYYVIGNLPIFIWLTRVYFQRLVKIENKLNQNN